MATRSAWISRVQKMMTFCSGPPFSQSSWNRSAHMAGCAQVDEQLVVEVLAGVFVLGEVFLGDGLAGLDVGGAWRRALRPW